MTTTPENIDLSVIGYVIAAVLLLGIAGVAVLTFISATRGVKKAPLPSQASTSKKGSLLSSVLFILTIIVVVIVLRWLGLVETAWEWITDGAWPWVISNIDPWYGLAVVTVLFVAVYGIKKGDGKGAYLVTRMLVVFAILVVIFGVPAITATKNWLQKGAMELLTAESTCPLGPNLDAERILRNAGDQWELSATPSGWTKWQQLPRGVVFSRLNYPWREKDLCIAYIKSGEVRLFLAKAGDATPVPFGDAYAYRSPVGEANMTLSMGAKHE